MEKKRRTRELIAKEERTIEESIELKNLLIAIKEEREEDFQVEVLEKVSIELLLKITIEELSYLKASNFKIIVANTLANLDTIKNRLSKEALETIAYYNQ